MYLPRTGTFSFALIVPCYVSTPLSQRTSGCSWVVSCMAMYISFGLAVFHPPFVVAAGTCLLLCLAKDLVGQLASLWPGLLANPLYGDLPGGMKRNTGFCKCARPPPLSGPGCCGTEGVWELHTYSPKGVPPVSLQQLPYATSCPGSSPPYSPTVTL